MINCIPHASVHTPQPSEEESYNRAEKKKTKSKRRRKDEKKQSSGEPSLHSPPKRRTYAPASVFIPGCKRAVRASLRTYRTLCRHASLSFLPSCMHLTYTRDIHTDTCLYIQTNASVEDFRLRVRCGCRCLSLSSEGNVHVCKCKHTRRKTQRKGSTRALSRG